MFNLIAIAVLLALYASVIAWRAYRRYQRQKAIKSFDLEKRQKFVLALPAVEVGPLGNAMVSGEPLRGLFRPHSFILRGAGLVITKIMIDGKAQMMGDEIPIEFFSPGAVGNDVVMDMIRFDHPVEIYLRNMRKEPVHFTGMIRGELIEVAKP